jgi:acetolactate synthase-1/2/3 large subunit
MHASLTSRTAAEVLVDQLIANGVRHVFCVPGESFLAVLDAFHDRDIMVTVCRQEGGAAMMAEAVGKATGRPGVCFVTRGPGATNASAGIHIAHQDSTPMIMFVGQVERGFRERESFQELDYKAVFGTMTKLTVEIDDAARVSEFVNRAFVAAQSGRPGPVVVSLPKDMLNERVMLPAAAASLVLETAPGAEDMATLEAMMAAAERPVFILGGSRWTPEACAAVARFAERFAMPMATSYRRTPLFDQLHPHYAGDVGLGPNPRLIARIKDADLVVLCGGRFGEIPSQGYTLFDIPQAKAKLVHVYAEAGEIGRVFQPTLAIHATPVRFAAALDTLVPRGAPAWAGLAEAYHADYLAWSEVPTPQPGAVNFGSVMAWLRDNVPPDTILCNGAGNYASFIHRFYRVRQFASHIAPTSASMGYGIPAAVAMQRLHPDRLVLSINGDGDFLMNGQDFATAVQYELPIVTVIADNGSYGTIRMHQEREFPGRVLATTLRNPDFAAYARAFGGFGASVLATAEFPEAFAAARASGLPSIIHCKTDPDAILPGITLTKIREQALARRG